MSHPPSRSEIESALSGRTQKSQPKPKPNFDFDIGEPPRRQQVLGGDLSGVNKNKKIGLFSRYSDINIAAWASTAVVLLIALAFFWPEPPNSVTEVSKQLDENRVVAVEDQELDDALSGQANFSRDSDFQRAEEFREQDVIDNQVRELLQKAAGHIRKRNLTQPKEDNAVIVYRQVLALSPNNTDAREGLGKIQQHFFVRGIESLDAEKPVLAQSYLDRLNIVAPESEDSAELKLAISEYNTDQEIATLLKQAKTAVTQNKLILPARESALTYYQEVLKLDEENETALNGIQLIADNYIEQANQSVLSGDFEAAAARLVTVALIDPEHKSIPLIEAMIARAKTVAIESQQEAQEDASTQTVSETPVQSTSANNVDDDNVTTEELLALEPTTETDPNRTPNTQTSTQTTAKNSAVNSNRTPDRQASEQETFDQQYLLQGLNAYYSGDYDKAATLLQPLADKGIARAQMRLAYMHFLGRGFTRNRTEADRIIRAALPSIRKFANEGRGWAQSDLGSLYEDGLVLPRDYGEAVYWYRTAAEKGYPGAQTNLGIMYARGRGVAASRRTAIEWFQRAAKQGDNVAKRNLQSLGIN